MAFDDMLDLRTAVVEQVGRPDIADVFPRLVSLAEAMFNRKLKTRDQITEVTLTLASGSVDLPTDFIEVIGIYNPSGLEYIQQTQQEAKANGCYYAINASALTIYGYDGDVTMQYYAKLPTISENVTDTNWLLEKYPGAYLYAVSFEAAKWMRDRELAADMGGLLENDMTDIYADDHRARYSRARVRVQGVAP